MAPGTAPAFYNQKAPSENQTGLRALFKKDIDYTMAFIAAMALRSSAPTISTSW